MKTILTSLLFTLLIPSLFAEETSGVTLQKDIAFLGSDRKEKMDLYLPAKKSGKSSLRPAILIIHGGGWHTGSRRAAREKNLATNLAEAGFVCASIDYVLAEKKDLFTDNLRQVWPDNLYDCMTAVRFLRANAAKYHINPEKIGAIGGSAGGHLVAMLGALSDRDELNPKDGLYEEHSSRIQAVVPMYGVYDLIGWAKSKKLLAEMGDADQMLCKAASPVTYADSSDPPVLLLHGTRDRLVPVTQTHSYEKVLERAGVKNEKQIIEGAPHSFHLQPKQRDLRSLVVEFFEEHLK